MAKKRVNKQLLMTLTLILMALLVVGVFLGLKYYRGNPDESRDNARQMAQQSRQELADLKQEAKAKGQADPQQGYEHLQEEMTKIARGAFHEAINQYGKAYKFAVRRGRDTLALEILDELAELNLEMDNWPQAMGLWQQMLQFQRSDDTLELHHTARRQKAQYIYTNAKTIGRNWQMVTTEAEALMELLKELKSDDVTGHTMKAHALLALAASREAKDVDEAIAEAANLLDQALKLDENSVDAYNLLAQLEQLQQRQAIEQDPQPERTAKAEAYLRAAVSKNPDNVEAYLNLYHFWLNEINRHYDRVAGLRSEVFSIASRTRQTNEDEQTKEKNPALQAVTMLAQIEGLDQALTHVAALLTQVKQSLDNLAKPVENDLDQAIALLEQCAQQWPPIEQRMPQSVAALAKGIQMLLAGPHVVADLLQSMEIVQRETLAQTALEQAQQVQLLVRLLGELTNHVQVCEERFAQDGRVYLLHARLTQHGQSTAESLSAAIAIAEKSLACQGAKSGWYADVAHLYYRRSNLVDNPQADLKRASELLHQGLYLPEMLLAKKKVPDEARIRRARLLLLRTTVDVCARLSMLSDDTQLTQGYLERAGQAMAEFKEKMPSEHFDVKLAQGMLALAEGNRDSAVSSLYTASELLAQSDPGQQTTRRNQGRLDWLLFETLQEDDQTMAALAYGLKALNNRSREGNYRKQLATWLQVAADKSAMPYLGEVVALARAYEQGVKEGDLYLTDVRGAHAKALLALGRRQDAHDVLEKVSVENAELKVLRASALPGEEERVQALEALVAADPANSSVVRGLLSYYMSQGPAQASYYDKARALTKAAREADPDNIALAEMNAVLAEPDPNAIPVERLTQIRLQVLQDIPDTFKRELALGDYYYRLAQVERAKARQIAPTPQGQQSDAAATLMKKHIATSRKHFTAAAQVEPQDSVESHVALFEVALSAEELEQADLMVQNVIKRDPVRGLWCQARLQAQRENYGQAVNDLKAYLAERPIAPEARVYLAQLLNQQGQPNDAVDQAGEAVAQDIASVPANRLLARLLHEVNRRDQANAAEWTLQDIQPVVQAVDRVLQRAPNDPDSLNLKAFYNPLLIGKRIDQLSQQTSRPDDEVQAMLNYIDALYVSTTEVLKRSVRTQRDNVRSWVRRARLSWQYADQLESLASVTATEAQRATKTDRHQAFNTITEQLKTRVAQLRGETEATYKAALKAHPKSVDLTEAYANHLRNLGQVEQAEALYQQVLGEATGAEGARVKLRLAQQFRQRGQISRAQTLVKEVLEADAANRQAKQLLAEIYVAQRDFGQAATTYAQLRQEQDNAALLMRQIQVLSLDNQYEQAAALIVQLKENYPEQKGTALLEAQIEQSQGNYAAAAALAGQIIDDQEAARKLRVDASLLQAEAFYFDRKYPQAETTLKAIRSFLQAGNRPERILLAQVYWAQGRRDDAINELKAAQADRAGIPVVQQRLLAYLKQDNRWSEVQAIYDKALEATPDSARLCINAARAFDEYGEVEKRNARELNAQSLFQKAANRMKQAWDLSEPDSSERRIATLEYEDMLVRYGRYAEAIAFADAVSKDKQPMALVLVNKAHAQYAIALKQANATLKQNALATFKQAMALAAHNTEQTRVVLERLLRLVDATSLEAWTKQQLTQPDSPAAMRVLLAQLYGAQNKVQQQIDLLLKASENASKPLAATVQRYLAIAYENDGQADQATQCYRRLLDLQPENPFALNNLAYRLVLQPGNEDEAAVLAEKAYRLLPNNTNVMDTFAGALLGKNEYQQAERIMRQAIQTALRMGEPVKAEFYYRLGRALQLQGRKAAARNQYNAAIETLKTGDSQEAQTLATQIRQALAELGR